MRENSSKLETKRTRKILLPLVLLALFLMASFVHADSETDRLVQEKTKELDKLIELQKQRITQKQEQAKTLKEEISRLEAQIKDVEQKISSINRDKENTQKDIDIINNDIKLTELNLKKEQEKLKKGIALIYERGNAGFIEVLASSSSVSSFLDQEKYLLAVNEDIASSVKKIRDIKTTLDQKRKKLEIKKQQQESLKAEQERAQQDLQGSIMAKDKLLEETKGDERMYQQFLDQALNDREQVSNMILAISSGASPQAIGLSYSGARAGHRVYRGEVIGRLGNTGFSSGPHLHFGVYQSKYDVDPMPLLTTNVLSFPASGTTITQGFLGTFSHKGRGPGWPGGIDFSGPEGIPVRAAKEGTIIFDGVGPKGIDSGFGHYVIIDHHNGFLTLYGHLR